MPTFTPTPFDDDDWEQHRPDFTDDHDAGFHDEAAHRRASHGRVHSDGRPPAWRGRPAQHGMRSATRRDGPCRATKTALARVAVAKFVRLQAQETAAAAGFGWLATAEAPSTYQQLRGAYAASQATGAPLPVSNLHCESSVFPRPEDNIAFRFWHDCSHVRLGLSFSLEDELELATWHLAQAEQAGFTPGSLGYRLLEADHVGQVLVQAVGGRFPFDQEAFVLTCAQFGLGIGVLAELRRVPGVDEGSRTLVTDATATSTGATTEACSDPEGDQW